MSHELLELKPFAGGGGGAALILRARVRRSAATLHLRYVVGGRVGGLRIPPPAAPGRADRLWEHTCFEAFLAPAGGEAYWEINLSPSGDWNTYRFDRHREGMRPEARVNAPAVVLERASRGTLTLRAVVDLAPLPELASSALDVGLAAVLEAHDGTLSHWALEHGSARPDFHRRAGFVLRLDGNS